MGSLSIGIGDTTASWALVGPALDPLSNHSQHLTKTANALICFRASGVPGSFFTLSVLCPLSWFDITGQQAVVGRGKAGCSSRSALFKIYLDRGQGLGSEVCRAVEL